MDHDHKVTTGGKAEWTPGPKCSIIDSHFFIKQTNEERLEQITL